jgi:hypothetical protein
MEVSCQNCGGGEIFNTLVEIEAPSRFGSSCRKRQEFSNDFNLVKLVVLCISFEPEFTSLTET